MFKGAIVGLGNVALNGHLPAWKEKPEFKIAAGVDLSEAQREAFRKLMPQAKTYTNIDECLEAVHPDFVDVSTPPFTHFQLAQKALEKGVNVLCEKPLVFVEDEFARLERAAKKNSKVLFTVHNWKFAPICLKISELLREKAVGEIRRLEWYVLRDGPARTTEKDNWRLNPALSGGGILSDHGWHAFYLLMNWIGKEPQSVAASLENRQYGDLPVEDTAKIRLEFGQSGAASGTADIFLTWASRLRKNAGVIEGTSGRIQMDDDSLSVFKKNGADESSQTFKFDAPLSKGSHHPDWFGRVIGEFSEELKNPERRGKNLKEAGACLEVIARSKESHLKEGARVPY